MKRKRTEQHNVLKRSRSNLAEAFYSASDLAQDSVPQVCKDFLSTILHEHVHDDDDDDDENQDYPPKHISLSSMHNLLAELADRTIWLFFKKPGRYVLARNFVHLIMSTHKIFHFVCLSRRKNESK